MFFPLVNTSRDKKVKQKDLPQQTRILGMIPNMESLLEQRKQGALTGEIFFIFT
jgi:hypothetical protein